MNGITWLASYPKSGNTWLRIFLANYQRNETTPLDINELGDAPIASARGVLDAVLGYESGDLSHDEIALLRPELYLHLVRQGDLRPFWKVHDAYIELPDGRPLFPSEATRAALYVVRNPLDVCVSMTHHNAHADFALTVRQMADDAHALSHSTRRQPLQLRQQLRSWSNHARSWLGAPGIRVHVIRYEDMSMAPLATFATALRFMGLEDTADRVQKALQFSSFAELQRQERVRGFRERMPLVPSFFRKGEVGSWRGVLSEKLAQTLIEQHAPMMRHFGYLDDAGNPVF